MSDAPQVKKLLETYGLEFLMDLVGKDAIAEVEAEIADLGGIDNVMSNKLPPPPAPNANPAFGLPGAPMTAGTARYRCTEQRPPEIHGGHISDVGPVEIITQGDTLDDEVVWRIDMRRVDNGLSFHHNVLVRAADHRLIRHEAGTPMRVFQGFVAGDFAHIRVKGGMGKAARDRLPEPAFASLWSLWTALAAAPLGAGWSTSANLLLKVSTFDWRFIPVRLEVSGEERVTVPAGTFDCWIVNAVGKGETVEVDDRYWVSRATNRMRAVVRAHERRHADLTRFYELASLDSITSDPAKAPAPETPSSPPPAAPSGERTADELRARRHEVDRLVNEIPAASDPMIRDILRLCAATGRMDLFAGLVEKLEEVGSSEARPSPTPSASLRVTLADARTTLDSIPLRADPRSTASHEDIAERAREIVRRIPSLAELQESDNVLPGTPHEAVARYEREMREYGEDVRAMLALEAAWADYFGRRVVLFVTVTIDSDEARPTRARLTVPSGIGIELPHEELGFERAVPPLPMKAPLDQTRSRLVPRLVPVRQYQAGQVPVERYSTPDGSTVLVVGPASVSRSADMVLQFAITFASWNSVKPFTLRYDISAEGVTAVSGSVQIGTHVAT